VIGAMITRRRVRSTYAALNRRDLGAFLAGWADDATFTFPGDVAASGRFVGRPAIAAWFRRFLDTFPELVFTVHRVCLERGAALGWNNVAAAHWEIALRNRRGETNRNAGVTMIRVARARVVAATDYVFDTGPDFRRIWRD